MTEIENAGSILNVERLSDQSARELATARADANAETLLHQAFMASGKTQRELARALEVTEGRVSQILSGQSSLRIATLARYLSVLGYQLEVAARPFTEGLPALPLPKRRRREDGRKIIAHTRAVHEISSPAHETSGPSWQIMFSFDKPHNGEGWTAVGEVEDLRGSYTPALNGGRATVGKRTFEINEGSLR